MQLASRVMSKMRKRRCILSVIFTIFIVVFSYAQRAEIHQLQQLISQSKFEDAQLIIATIEKRKSTSVVEQAQLH